jgi:hypothetical protein
LVYHPALIINYNFSQSDFIVQNVTRDAEERKLISTYPPDPTFEPMFVNLLNAKNLLKKSASFEWVGATDEIHHTSKAW